MAIGDPAPAAPLTTDDEFAVSIPLMRQRRGSKWHLYPEDVLPAWVADMDWGVPPGVQAAIQQVVSLQDYRYARRDPEERPEQAFTERMRDRFGWSPDPELSIVMADLVQAITACVLAFSDEGQGVLTQTPIYPPYLAVVEATRRRRVDNALVDTGTRYAIDPDHLRSVVDADTRVILLCNPHNPTGRAFTVDELRAIGNLAVERDLVIVADEIHCDLVYEPNRHIPIETLGADIAAQCVTLNSATKSFNIPGLRCGVVHFGSRKLLERFQHALPGHILGAPSVLGMDATVAAWRTGQPWLDRVLRLLRANRDRVSAWVAAQPRKIHYYAPEATYLAWLGFQDAGLPESNVHQYLLEHAKVGLNDGTAFGPGGVGHVRLNFATSPEVLDQVLQRMSSVLS